MHSGLSGVDPESSRENHNQGFMKTNPRGQSIPRDGMRLIKLADTKVTKLVSEFPAYVKNVIETTLPPHTATLEAVTNEQRSIKSQLQPIELRLKRIESGGEKCLPAIKTELQQVKTQLSALDSHDIAPLETILPLAVELFSTQPHVSTEPHVNPSPERDDEDDDDEDRSER
ncbi:hypothetical protein K7X08_020051 [Anisodus acutangulus]|uniref:Uncharacterized protein n=1 Tax=Anisodus acutangulus TaxID=402998 RepID=A0A9Q1M5Q7_9SOLA|nr:hypothetical protein K7X08_020051 [Anisodus acutangulus]